MEFFYVLVNNDRRVFILGSQNLWWHRNIFEKLWLYKYYTIILYYYIVILQYTIIWYNYIVYIHFMKFFNVYQVKFSFFEITMFFFFCTAGLEKQQWEIWASLCPHLLEPWVNWLHKKPWFHQISWRGNFVKTPRFIQKLPSQEIRWHQGILSSDWYSKDI